MRLAISLVLVAVTAAGCVSENRARARQPAPKISATPDPPERASCQAEQRAKQPPTAGEQLLGEWLSGHESLPRPDLAQKLERACQPSNPNDPRSGDAIACTVLGVMTHSGDGVKQNSYVAELYFRRATVRNGFDLGGCAIGAASYSEGISSRSSACDRGAMECPARCQNACGLALDELRARTIEPLLRSCDSGRGAACYLLGIQYTYGVFIDELGYLVEADAGRGMRAFERACEAGVAKGCGMLVHVDPLESQKAPAEEHELRRKACSLGDGESCLDAAATYRSVSAAEKLYVRGCELGMVLVCRELETLYSSGNELKRDPVAARRFGKLGADPWY